jgi:diguanylate cyclase (GGDEF)-like protein
MCDSTVIYICIFFLFLLTGIALFFAKRITYFRKLSETDQMTLLLNYRGLCRNIEKLFTQEAPLSVAILDIDNFRNFNLYGYKLGDAVLKEFASLLNKTFSEDDLIARFRLGDEFVIVFPNTEFEQAENKIKKFKEICGSFKFSSIAGFSDHTISFSEGIVEKNANINSIDSLFSEAEKSLKENKAKKTFVNQ